jgi:hypothetical protein
LNFRSAVKEFLSKQPDTVALTTLISGISNQKRRPFGTDGGGLKYSESACLPAECGSADLSPAIEFKSGRHIQTIKDLEKFFVQRVAKFACACINQRCNGTIYFGVGDNKVRNN